MAVLTYRYVIRPRGQQNSPRWLTITQRPCRAFRYRQCRKPTRLLLLNNNSTLQPCRIRIKDVCKPTALLRKRRRRRKRGRRRWTGSSPPLCHRPRSKPIRLLLNNNSPLPPCRLRLLLHSSRHRRQQPQRPSRSTKHALNFSVELSHDATPSNKTANHRPSYKSTRSALNSSSS